MSGCHWVVSPSEWGQKAKTKSTRTLINYRRGKTVTPKDPLELTSPMPGCRRGSKHSPLLPEYVVLANTVGGNFPQGAFIGHVDLLL
jgi:hypothetical protein